MKTTTIAVGAYEENCTILETNGKTLVVDPGAEADTILAALDRAGLVPDAILVTHGHFDHIGGIPGLRSRWPTLRILVNDTDAKILSHPFNQSPPEYPPFPAGIPTEPPERYADEFGYTVIPTPGHTPGGVCYHFAKDNLLLSGDTLFCGSVGRTDFPGGDMAALMDSLQRLKTLPDNTRVVPGHGPETTIGAEKRGKFEPEAVADYISALLAEGIFRRSQALNA